jgi:23S rRNA (cytosine1962-C5)-methyltransferase
MLGGRQGSLVLLVNFLPPPCLLFEDDDLLVVHKPSGINTHAPSPHHNEGLYEWLRHREPRWASLGIIHRLDKSTSGILLFTKSSRANRSLAQQFDDRSVQKRYLFLTDRPVPQSRQTLRSALVRTGQHYISRPCHPGSDDAETHFHRLNHPPGPTLMEAIPLTGRTHQVRVHAAALGFPILGDTLYGGTPSQRLCLHAEQLTLRHPSTDKPITFRVDADFQEDPRRRLRSALIHPQETSAWRLIHGAADEQPGWYVDRFDDQLLSQSDHPPTASQQHLLQSWMNDHHCRGLSHKSLLRQPGTQGDRSTAAPRLISGQSPAARFEIRENNVGLLVSFQEGYSVGLFLDQRDNRRRILSGHVAAGFELPSSQSAPATVLNAFAYTCAFSVCAALTGALTTSIDLSRNYLEWGRANFKLNRLDPEPHSFLHGDVFSWLRRLARQSRSFNMILLDPPTFSRSKESGTFRAETDFPRLISAALPCLKPNGVLFASSNATQLEPESFLDQITAAIRASGRLIQKQHYGPQPPDFPITREEPAHLKSIWFAIR